MEVQLDDDDRLIALYLGPKYLGRRYLRYAEIVDLGLAENRTVLKKWMAAGHFPRALKIAGPRGQALRWFAVEIARLVAKRLSERDEKQAELTTPDNRTAGPARDRPF